MKVNIRKANSTDKDFLISLSERFNEISFMDWRDPKKMSEAQVRIARESIENKHCDSAIFIAEDENQERLGFLNMTKTLDYFTGEEQAYISSLAVTIKGEGKGIAKKLMETAEEWSRKRGYKQLTLNVFVKNDRAMRFYQNLNYEIEIVKMTKEI